MRGSKTPIVDEKIEERMWLLLHVFLLNQFSRDKKDIRDIILLKM